MKNSLLKVKSFFRAPGKRFRVSPVKQILRNGSIDFRGAEVFEKCLRIGATYLSSDSNDAYLAETKKIEEEFGKWVKHL